MANTTKTPKRKLPRFLSILLAVILIIAVSIGGVYVWALLSTDTSLTARGIAWGDSDVDDWQRFPSRTMQASPHPVIFAAGEPVLLDEFTTGGKTYGFEEYFEESDATAFIILHGDEVLYEQYFNGASRESIQHSFSVTKSFTSTLVGIAIEEGYINSLDDPVTDYLPELVDHDARFADITLRNLITMSAGLRFERTSAPVDDGFISYYGLDLRQAALESEIIEPPGSQFRYNDYIPPLLGMVLERTTDMSIAAYTESRLWQPMGAEGEGLWSLDSEQAGFEKVSHGLNGRPIDLAKLGWLFLNEGRNGDRQVVPAAWVDEATRLDTTTDPAADYQYFWWIDQEVNAYWAEGDKCQYIYVYPDANLVLVRTGRTCGDNPGFDVSVLRAIAVWVEEQFAIQ